MKPRSNLTEVQRAKRVLISQGKAAVLVTSSLKERLSEIAALCGEDGRVKSGAAEAFARIWNDHITTLNARKASDAQLED